MDDQDIIDLYWHRSEHAITETALKYGAYCRRIAWNILYNDDDAEECLNDTYLKAWQSMPPTRPTWLSSFLGKITRHLALDAYRKTHAAKRGHGQVPLALNELEECVPGYSSIDDALDYHHLVACLNAFLHDLPFQQRKTFMLRYWYLLSLQEIAKEMQTTENNVAVQLSRLRKKLRTALKKEGILL